MTQFSADEWLRYTRHIQLPQIGPQGQKRLKDAHVLIVGAGGLGCPVALYLAAAGVGQLTIVDADRVDVTNLQRQVLYTTDSVGKLKAEEAKAHLLALNPSIQITAITEPFALTNGPALVADANLVMDCTDNFATRYLINDLCIEHKTPWIFASIHQFSGQCALFTPETACFRCLFPEAPQDIPDCNAAGVLGVLPGLLGTFQANEALKYLSGMATPLKNTLLLVEATDLTFRKIKLNRNEHCVSCHQLKSPQELQNDYQLLCSSNDLADYEVSSQQFDQWKTDKHYRVIDVRSLAERQAFHIGGEHIPLDDIQQALQQKPQAANTIVCYCQSGKRSAKAVAALKEAGIDDCYSLAGGIQQWLKEHQIHTG
ncbi:HesA/MoeB/ThiF family protein [Pleionea sp. CnH1-48]|uniref:HesA/MoeB/ThiF family protein n=1 Tax=Pleionea sp. CnH1-48 TaxID=2954494 RepID=UPI002096B0AA|nr:HesA/MoeB/ThiF family protein [Pleionea sp. CnH1-48]MCO7223871.1 HesA/MoeB/ThiF family protein [Pleionea sp. CnH1-48]